MILDYRAAPLELADRALCQFAEKLTLEPGSMSQSDVSALRAHGFSDDAIHIATQVIAYFNYINRIADALGVDPEPWMTPTREQWLKSKGKWPTRSG